MDAPSITERFDPDSLKEFLFVRQSVCLSDCWFVTLQLKTCISDAAVVIACGCVSVSKCVGGGILRPCLTASDNIVTPHNFSAILCLPEAGAQKAR